MGGERACTVGDCCRACELVAGWRQGSVMLRSVWSTVCTLCCAVRGIAAWSLFEGVLFTMWMARRLSWVVAVARFVGRGASRCLESVVSSV